ncbi:branched-chain amino acid ABC transporter permease [Pusillimonas noertemannii]|uniref:Amino acid/amide ABC transporter membrane protein 1 (HAAT family) n=1 Tax=Pusillimonas noertemannii TaxID=305977 RepID=A0A2U1CQV2_9BURK|nr:branched-chain amino acid ABC transporter permease [Pusillimonas noertemannii]NYT67593.1 branched-chain amino acid ABC transporter permease [Pusillimonas noertemannii]PVY68265.1 amino acid/amide ABC transporter membrane protein 1 (HAAT family) [Pusillimonas noertemannii]TFL12241.1 branched-chain amino acid ABC transporter permease [Pusillimonas noertemannii]
MNPYVQGLFSGLMNGATYALLGIGLVLAFRTSRVLNLAHGETFVVATVAIVFMLQLGAPLWAAIAVAILLTGLLYCALQRFTLQPRGHWPIGALILITLGAAFLVRGVVILLIGAEPVSFPSLFTGAPVRIAGGVIPRQGVAMIVIGFGLSIAVTYLLSRTRIGKELIATAENSQAAQLLGIDVNRARMIAYAVAAVLGAVSAVLLVPLIAIDYQIGLAMTTRGFIAAAIAGMSPGRTVVSGLFLGIFESMVIVFFGALFQDPVMFGLLIAVALWQSRSIRFGGGVRA